MQNEEWRPVPGLEEKFEVSNFGQVRSVRRPYIARMPYGDITRWRKGRLLKQQITRYGYCQVAYCENDYTKTYRVHRLVAMAFVLGQFEGAEVDHLDGNKRNNRADNLEWVTKGENTKRAWRMGLTRSNPSKVSDLKAHAIRVLYQHNFPPSMIAEWFGVSDSYAYQIGAGKLRAEKLESRQKPSIAA